MNLKFAEHSTSVAFSLALTKLQCHALLALDEQPLPQAIRFIEVYNLQGLERRGLVWWAHMADGTPNGFKGLTEEGRLVCQLLRRAGITSENSITLSVAKRMARAEETK